jgi:hypothetical protein
MRRSTVLNIPLQLVFLGCTGLIKSGLRQERLTIHNMLSGFYADCRVTLIVILSVFMLNAIVAGCPGTFIIK